MGLMDMDGFGSSQKIEDTLVKSKEVSDFVENSFNSVDTGDVSNLIKFYVINSKYNMGDILKNYLHLDIGAVNMFCPFHDDESSGKPSAKYYEQSDTLYCYSEGKSYTAYHAMKLIGINTDKVFMDIWRSLSYDGRQAYLDKYGENSVTGDIKITLPEEWVKYRESVLGQFSKNKVSFKQHKTALFKILSMISKSEGEKKRDFNNLNRAKV